MRTLFSRTEPLGPAVLDVYCEVEGEYHRKFLYFSREGCTRLVGLGSVFAEADFEVIPHEMTGSISRAPVMFAAAPFDSGDPKPANALFGILEGAGYVLPEVVLIEQDGMSMVQVNSAEPIAEERFAALVDRLRLAGACDVHSGRSVDYTLEGESREAWAGQVEEALARIRGGEFDKIVLASEFKVETTGGFLSRDMILNLIAAGAAGALFLYELDGAFFVGSTPELLVRKQGDAVMTMCLAGTATAGDDDDERARAAEWLLADEKNLREHGYVVEHLRESLLSMCTEIEMPAAPEILRLRHVQHLFTPVRGTVDAGVSLVELRDALHPTPALAGYPVEEATAAIREMETFSRGLYGGTFGYVDFDGNGEFSVSIRSGVFSRDHGFIYAGCGIVEGSDPDAEYDEINAKLKTILSALQGELG